MKKNITILAAIFIMVLVLLYIFMPSGILVEPNITPTDYLNSIPYVTIFNRWIIIVPLSTIIVYALGIQIMLIGYVLIKNRQTVWGISLLFWGLGTLLAGTSYQGLGFELKCRDQVFCQFTSWFELSYLFVTAISIALMAIAFAQEFLRKDRQKHLIGYAKVALIVYTVLLVMGSILENRLLISYEIFTIFFMPLFVVFFVINIINYRKHKDKLNRSFIQLWIWFLIVNVAYYVYYIPGFTESLFENTGIYFSANDVLHLGLMGWFGLMLFGFKKNLFQAQIKL